MAAVAYGSLPFQQQIAFFRGKRNVLTESWTDVWQAEHDNAFMVAGANRVELVADFRDAVRAAIEDGATLEDFRKDFDRIVAKHGWDYNGGRNWRSRVIYETNLRQSYNAGRWNQLQQLKKARPYWRYKHSDAVEHPRPVHLSWNDKIWVADDPVWQAIYPANGWGCQCYVEALNERDLKRLGKNGPDPSPQLEWTDAVVGQRSPGGPRTVRTVVGVDPGFAYAPGSSLDDWPTRRGGPRTPEALQRTLEQSAQSALRKSTRLPAAPAAQLLQEIFGLERAHDAVAAGYAEFQAQALTALEPHGSEYFVGLFDDGLLATLASRGMTPTTAAITVRDGDVLRTLATNVAEAALAGLPALLRTPRAVLFDTGSGDVLYLADADGAAQLLVRVAARGAVNAYRTAVVADLPALAGDVRSGRLVLLRGNLE
jgi:hypothetical protein